MKQSTPFNKHRWWIILNPVAGNGQGAKKRALAEALLKQHQFEYELVESTHPELAYSLVKDGIRAGYRHIMGIGGDGTNNEIINGIMRQQIVPAPEITYTLLPVGTGNDWIKMHKIPGNLRNWIPKIATGKTILHDVGLLTYQKNEETKTRYFINVAGLAYDAFVTGKKSANSGTLFPKLYYLWMVVICLFKYTLRKATIEFNNKKITDRFYTINIGICKYSGGGMQLVPHADPQSGQLALTVAGPVRRAEVVLYTPNIFMGTLHKHPQVAIYHTNLVEIVAAEEHPTLLEADGEFLGHTPVRCEILPAALKILVP